MAPIKVNSTLIGAICYLFGEGEYLLGRVIPAEQGEILAWQGEISAEQGRIPAE